LLNRLGNVCFVFSIDDLAPGETVVCLFILQKEPDEKVNSGYQKKPADAKKVQHYLSVGVPYE